MPSKFVRSELTPFQAEPSGVITSQSKGALAMRYAFAPNFFAFSWTSSIAPTM